MKKNPFILASIFGVIVAYGQTDSLAIKDTIQWYTAGSKDPKTPTTGYWSMPYGIYLAFEIGSLLPMVKTDPLGQITAWVAA